MLLGGLLSLTTQAQVSVSSRQPARHAPAAPRSGGVTVGFSQAISAVSAPNLRVYGGWLRGKRPGTLSGGGSSTLTFVPSQDFAPGEPISVSLPSTLVSPGGSAVSRQVYQFTAATGGLGRGFYLDTTIVGNTTTRDQVLADIDNDGDLDLITTGSLFGCRLYANNGAGQFSFLTGVVTAEEPSGVAMADVDQDGDLDMLVSDATNATVAVCLNDGTGQFLGSVTGAQNAPVGPRPVGVAAGDVDGDGDLDFVTANADGNSASVRFNNGSGLFATVSTVAMGSGPSAVALADIDNDGDLDLLTANAGTVNFPASVVNVSRNNGAGSFGAYTSVAVGVQPTELVLGDVDGDGDLDLLTANKASGYVTLRLNNGTGSFTANAAVTLALPTGSTPTGLRLGDVDADGDLDLVVAQGAGGRVITFLNTAGSFAVQARPLRLNRTAGSGRHSIGVTLGDVDGDLDLDLITSDDNGLVVLSRNLGTPAPLPAPSISGLSPNTGPVGAVVSVAGQNLTDVVAVRFNGLPAAFTPGAPGTALDAVVPAGATTGLVTVETEDAGTATSPGPFTVTIPVPVRLTSLTPTRNSPSIGRGGSINVSFSAAVTAATADNLRVFGSLRRGRRAGTLSGGGTTALTFSPSQDFAPGEQVSLVLPASMRAADGNQVARQVVQFTAAAGGTGRHDFVNYGTLALPGDGRFQVGDLDNDGDVDVVIPAGAGGLQLRLNTGNGTFTNGPTLTSPTALDLAAVGDVDGDGDLDLVGSSTLGNVAVWLNNGSGTFASAGSQTLTLSTSLLKLLLADVDADGDLDLLAVANNVVATLFNNGGGSFGSRRDVNFASNTTDVILGDVDNDGDLDLFWSSAGSSQNYITLGLNDGSGTFTYSASLAIGTGYTVALRLVLGDVDNDGDLDLALMGETNYQSRVYLHRNDGTGRFVAQAASVPLAGTSVVLADLDADGDLDLVGGTGISVNDGTGSFGAPIAFPGGNSPMIAAVDMDGDLDLDLFVAEQNNVLRVRLNRPGPPPTLTSLTPGSGPVGSSVLLTGQYLTTTSGLSFNGTAAPGFVVLAPGQVLATVPAGATSGPLELTTPAGTASLPFTVTEPLNVTSLNPARHAVAAPRTTAVSLGFSQPVTAATAASLRVFGAQRRGRLAGTTTGGGTSTLTFTPAQPLVAGEQVSVSVPAELSAADGSRARRQVYQFTAAAGGTGTGLFRANSYAGPIAAHLSRYGFAVGDTDGDGDLDVLSNDGRIRFNDGLGAFADSAAEALFPTQEPRTALLVDLDADGDLDALTSNGWPYLNGGGILAWQPQLPGMDTTSTRDLAVGDLDADGDLDLVAPNYLRDSVYVRFNNGAGAYSAPLRVAVGSRPTSIVLADVDNDGDLDFVTGNAGVGAAGSTISVGLNTGIGVFTTVRQLAAGTGLLRLRLGDVDGDGDLDLVTNNGLVRLNDGTGQFGGSQTTAAGRDLVLGDVDADGDLDLLVSGTGSVALRRNDGTGQFGGTETVSLGSGTVGGQPLLADLDADGDLDLLVADLTRRKILLFFNERLAAPVITSFAPARDVPGATVLISGADFIGTTSVAFNGVATNDFTVLTASRITVRVPAAATSGLLQVVNTNGTASSATAFTVLQAVSVTSTSPVRNALTAPRTAPVSVQFGQPIPVNSPATLAVFSERRGGLRGGTRTGAGSSTLTLTPAQPYEPGEVLRVSIPPYLDANARQVQRQVYQFTAAVGGTGRGVFIEGQSRLVGGNRPPVLGDVNGDGAPDELYIRNSEVQMRLNNGSGSFGAISPLFTFPAGGLGGLTLGDVDGDGDLDLLLINAYGYTQPATVYVRLNNGAGGFSGTLQTTVGEGAQRLALADVDADGDLDLISANAGQYVSSLSVRLNNGAGQFGGNLPDVLITGGGAQNVANLVVGDMDNDGDVDLIASTNYTGRLYLNDGQGRFSRSPTSPWELTYNFTTMSINDVDADGDLDVVLLRVPNGVSVLLNDGAGNLNTVVDSGNLLLYGGYDGLAVGDLDADGDVDVMLTNLYQHYLRVMTNDGTGRFTGAQWVQLPNLTQPLWPVLGDLDRDGDLDLVFGSGYSYTYHWLNTPGQGTPTKAGQLAELGVSLYPNPARDQFTVLLPPALRPTATSVTQPLRLYNAVGQLVLEQPLHPGPDGRLTVPVARLKAGVYTLRLTLNGRTLVDKVVLY